MIHACKQHLTLTLTFSSKDKNNMQQYPGAPPFLQPQPGAPAAPPPQPAWQPPQGAPSATPGWPPPQGAPPAPPAPPPPPQPAIPGYSAPPGFQAPNPYAPPPPPPPPMPAYPQGVVPQGAPPGFQVPPAPPPAPVPPPPGGYGAPAGMGMQVPWAGMATAQLSEEGTKLGDGTYVVQIVKCLGKQTQQKGFCFIAEFVVVTSSNPNHPPGSQASFVQDFKITQTAWSRLLHFCAALLGKDLKNPDQQAEVRSLCEGVMNQAIAGAYAGKYITVQSTKRLSRENREYQRYNFLPYTG